MGLILSCTWINALECVNIKIIFEIANNYYHMIINAISSPYNSNDKTSFPYLGQRNTIFNRDSLPRSPQ